MSARPVRSIAVIGDGVAAWAAAAAFATRFPEMRISVSPVPGSPPGLVDIVGTAPPSILDFHADLRIDEREVMTAAHGVFRLGSRYENWGQHGQAFLRTHGTHGEALDGVAFHQNWLRLAGEAGRFDDYSPASVLAKAERFTRPDIDPESPFSNFSYGLTLNSARYAVFLRKIAIDRGAKLDATGHDIDADLIVNTVAPSLKQSPSEWIDWAEWIPGGWLTIDDAPPLANAPLVESVAAHPGGWRMTIPLRANVQHLDMSANQSDGAVRVLPGRRKIFWAGNVVAIADAAVAIEPLDGVALHLIYSQIDRVIAMMPATDFAPVELAEYNRQASEEADRIRDFIALHYQLSQCEGERWRAAREVKPPATLAQDLMLFKERGMLPVHDHDSFQLDDWLSVLFGRAVWPRRRDPMALELDREGALRSVLAIRDRLAKSVQNLPPHKSLLAQLEG